MEWHDDGIVLATRKHGETGLIIEVMTRAHGRHLGLVRGGRSRKRQPLLQPGNRLALVWRARLDEHLGQFQAEPLDSNAARLMQSPFALYGLHTLAAHLRLLPERDPHHDLYQALCLVVQHLGEAALAAELLARFELRVLEELGFGLDLSRCAATGSREDLVYVSPKSGSAVCRSAGLPYHDRMLPLPAFLHRTSERGRSLCDMEAAFALTGYFLARHVYEPRGIAAPEARSGFLAAMRRVLADRTSQAPASS